jgi:hypothetical protein
MSEIDLIPEDYRKLGRLREWAVRLAIGGLALMLVLGGARAGLSLGIRRQEREAERLREAQALALDQQAKLDRLRALERNLRGQLDMLARLRGGVAARRMLIALDRALEGRVWLLDWTFRRAGELVEKKPEAVRTGYFIVVPKREGDERERAWLMQTHMEIQAQAFDHASLAAFVRRLVEQPEIEDVGILSAQVRRYVDAQVVHFELAVVVRSGA